MAEENWAAFGLSSEQQDDDWGDFGGFESATPVSDPQGGTASSFISWAAFPSPAPSAVSQNVHPSNQQIPQTLSSPPANQHMTEPFPAAGFPATVSQGLTSVGSTTALPANQQVQFTSAFPLMANQEAPSSIPWSSGSAGTPGDHTNITQTGLNANVIASPYLESSNGPPLMASETGGSEVQGSKQKQQDSLDMSRKHTEDLLMQEKKLKEARDAKVAMENKVETLEKQLTTAEKEKLRMQQELNELLEKSKKTESDAEKLTESLEKQTDKYKKLQDQHQEQLEDIRKGGHDALAIIVEEYKELSKKAVNEQQEQSRIQMQAFLAEERMKFQQIIEEQQKGFEDVLIEEREKNSKQIQEALQELKEKHKEEIQTCLQEERQKSQESMNKAVEEAREQGVQATERTIQQERETFEKTIEEHKEGMLRMMEEERRKGREMAEEAIKKERECSKVALLEALAQEKQRSKEATKEASEETKTEMLEYLKEKQKADAACRHRHFLSLDLFLESARTQLQSLMNDKEDDTL